MLKPVYDAMFIFSSGDNFKSSKQLSPKEAFASKMCDEFRYKELQGLSVSIRNPEFLRFLHPKAWFQVTAPLRVRGCFGLFFCVLLVSTWRFPGLRGGWGGGGRGNYVHWKRVKTSTKSLPSLSPKHVLTNVFIVVIVKLRTVKAIAPRNPRG